MSSRYKGSILSATAATNSQSAAVGVWRPNEVLQAVNASLWPLGITYDPYFKYVTLLLHGDGTNGAQNNFFIDSSTNNFAITRNGNTTQGTFTPYGDNWSNYFNGSSQYLSLTDSTNGMDLGGATASLEMWVYTTSANECFITKGGGVASYSTTNGIEYTFAFVSSAFTFYSNASGTYQTLTDSVTRNLNTWYHVVIATNATIQSLYVNGTRTATLTAGITKPTTRTGVRIGLDWGTSYYTGYLSNIRFIQGTGAYDASQTTITVPTSALTAVTNTTLLTCQSNRFIDNSTNAYVITAIGSPSIQRFSPFSPPAAYSTSVIGGSGYFDGSSSLSTSSSNTALPTGTQDFSVELWVYWATQSGSYPQIITNPTTSGFQIYYDVGAGALSVGIFNVANVITYTISQATLNNTWNHIAVTRSGNTFRLFVNGVLRSNGTNVISFAALTTQYFGSDGSRPYTGYITDVRTVLGSIPTAYQTSSTTNGTSVFTPPTAPLTAVSGTALLLNYTNGGIYDNAMMNDLTTVGSAQVSTTQVKFGTGSMYFNGSSYLNEPSSQNFAITNVYTVECWLYLTAAPTGSNAMYITDFRGGSTNNYALGVINSGSNTILYAFCGSGGGEVRGSTNIATGTWYHLAYVNTGSTLTGYLNGVSQGTLAVSFSQAATNVIIGARYTGSTEYVNGYIDDLRITKGYARYTTTFTPPTAAFPNQ